jgi:phage-related protein
MKPLFWVGSSKKDLLQLPDAVQDEFGHALYVVQEGFMPATAKTLKGFSGAGVLELVENYDGGTYRAVYTVKFENGIYVLHCFQKKSKSGIATPKQDMDLIKARLRQVQEEHERWKKKKA